MKDTRKTKAQLTEGIEDLRKRLEKMVGSSGEVELAEESNLGLAMPGRVVARIV